MMHVERPVRVSEWLKFTGIERPATVYILISKRLQNGIQSARLENCRGDSGMLYYALLFLIIAIVAAILGFGGLADTSAAIAKMLFLVFIVVFVLSLVLHIGRRA